MRCTTFIFLLLSIIIAESQQTAHGQTTNPSRLIATSTDYQVFSEWQAFDSAFYTYSMSNFMHDTHAPTYLFNGLQGRLAVPTLFDASYFFTGLFPEVSSPLYDIGSRWKFDSLINYYHTIEYPDVGEWHVEDRKKRTYQNNQVSKETILYTNSTSGKSISYNNAGQPLTYVNTLEPGGDSVRYIEFIWVDNALVQYTGYNFTPNLDKDNEHIFTLDNYGRTTEELIRSYEGTTDDVSKLEGRWTISYDANGFVTRLQKWLPDNDDWVSDWDKHIIMDGAQPIKTFTLTREIDTVSTPTNLSNWDTLDLTDLYFSGGKLDSVIKKIRDSNGVLALFSGEYFSYTEGKINIYDRIYKEAGLFNFNEHINHAYDVSGRLIAIYRQVDYPGFSTAYDTLFYYDDIGNIVLKELYSGTCYDQPCTYVPTEEVARFHYYYEQTPFAGTGEGSLYLHVYPSPANYILYIQLAVTDDLDDETQLIISNMQGNVVYRTTLGPGITFHQVDCSNWVSGMYAVRVLQDENTAWQKVMVK